MNETNEYYLYYKKLIQLSLEEPVEDVPEYKWLYESYPHIAESIKLRRETKKLKKKIKSSENGSERIQKRIEMFAIKEKLRMANINKNLFGENKLQNRFNRRFKFETSKQKTYQLKKRVNATFKNAHIILRSKERKIRRFLRKKLPPIIPNLGSLDISEKCLDVKEWTKKF
jgi:hypothetical protein